MKTVAVDEELTQARRSGPLREFKIPPCPELLTRLRTALQQPQPDMTEVQAVAAADVAMSATLIRVANSPVHLGDGLQLLLEGAYVSSQMLGPEGPVRHLAAVAARLIDASLE